MLQSAMVVLGVLQMVCMTTRAKKDRVAIQTMQRMEVVEAWVAAMKVALLTSDLTLLPPA